MRRRTKIVCTIGPASDSPEMLEALMQAGMDCARLNFSHGKYEEHQRRYERIREIAKKLNRPIAILQDLQGPKIRVGKLPDGGISLQKGEELTITTKEIEGKEGLISTTYQDLADDVEVGDRILLDDGLLELEVIKEASSGDILTKIVIGGTLTSNKGINLPGVKVSSPALTPKDKKDLSFGLSLGVDYVALSFVRHPNDLKEAKEIIHAAGKSTPVIAKLEKPEAVKQLEAIADEADGIMVARGDLGVEMKPEKVPLIQKKAIEIVNARGKIVITATQMLDSMIQNPRPTRAEASDVANAILDGTDAIMLSGETAVGKYPVKAVEMMDQIALAIESSSRYRNNLATRVKQSAPSFRSSLALATVAAAKDLHFEAIACFTRSGQTAELLSEYRPTAPIVALTPHEGTAKRLAIHWGVFPIVVPMEESTDAMIKQMERVLLEKGLAKKGDSVAITLGVPGGQDSSLLLLHQL